MGGDPHRVERELGLPDYYRALDVWDDVPPADWTLAAVHLAPKRKPEKGGGLADFIADAGFDGSGALRAG